MNAIEVNRTDIRCVCGKYVYFNQINVEGTPVNQLFCANCGLMMRSPGTDKNGEWLKEEWKKHVEPKRGKWVERRVSYVPDSDIYEMQSAKCSACGLYHTTPYQYFFKDYKFCPHCGAKMERSENND